MRAATLHRSRPRTATAALSATVTAALVALSAAGCGPADDSSGTLRVVTTTEILADLVDNVGGGLVTVDPIVPAGGDPHSYEPTPSDAKKVSRADVTFTNHLLLEEHALIKTIDTNAPEGSPNVSLAENAESYGAHVIPLVENIALDVLWLGLAVRGDGKQRGATRTSEIIVTATSVEGPGDLAVYLTRSLGDPEVYVDSSDGLDDADRAVLPPAAHTHVNWAFTAPGRYQVTLAGSLSGTDGAPAPVATATFTFAVGVDPHTVRTAGGRPATVLDGGHTDLAVDLDQGTFYAYADDDGSGSGEQREVAATDVVIDVPNRAADTVPDDSRFSFLGKPGSTIYQLPQAVLGKHVHGEIDPHLWQDVRNAKSYVQLIRDTLADADPDHAEDYRNNAERYLDELDQLHRYVGDRIATVPADRRQLVTTHDGFGYLANAYDLTVAGFVVPNPGQEPSAEQVRRLGETIRNLRVPAVFTEPNLAQRAAVLTQVAADNGIRVCKLYGDAFDDDERTYLTMMRHNADELVTCLRERTGS